MIWHAPFSTDSGGGSLGCVGATPHWQSQSCTTTSSTRQSYGYRAERQLDSGLPTVVGMSFLRREVESASGLRSSGALSDQQAWDFISSALSSHEQRLAVLRVLAPADSAGLARPPWPAPALLFVTDRSLLLGLQAGSYVWLAFCISLEDVHAFQLHDHKSETKFAALITVDDETGRWPFDLSEGSSTPTGRAEVVHFIDRLNVARAAHSSHLTPAWALG